MDLAQNINRLKLSKSIRKFQDLQAKHERLKKCLGSHEMQLYELLHFLDQYAKILESTTNHLEAQQNKIETDCDQDLLSNVEDIINGKERVNSKVKDVIGYYGRVIQKK